MGPEELGRYRLRRVLGRGTMGEVWEAQDSELGRRVAVKILRAGDDDMALARMRFTREARAAAILRHPNLVAVHDAGEAAGTCFIVMELVEGRTFRVLARADDVSVEDKVRWIREVAEALRAMHHAGIVHRDVKPVNVLVRPGGSACLVDLGISKWKSPDMEPSLEIGDGDLHEGDLPDEDIEGELPDGEAISAPQAPLHVPPEARLAGIYDERGDQYAWAVTAYELLSGAPPSSEAPLGVRPGISSRVASVIERARSSSPLARFERMDDLIDALRDDDEDDEAPPSPPADEAGPAPPPRSVRRATSRSAIVAQGAFGAVAIVALFIVAVSVGRWAMGGANGAQIVPPAVASIPPSGPARKISIGSLEERYRTSTSSPVEDQRAVVSAKKSAMEACVRQHPPQCPMSMVVVCQLEQDGTVPSCLSSAPGKCEARELGLCLERAVPMKLPGSEKRPAASDFALELVVD